MPTQVQHSLHHDLHCRRQPPPRSSIKKRKLCLLTFFVRTAFTALLLSIFFLFVGVAVLVLLQLLLASGNLRRHRRHGFPAASVQSSSGYSPEELLRLSHARYEPSDSSDECVVCLAGLQGGDWCRTLPGCRHVFHLNCIDKWLIRVPICPICRRHVPLDVA